MNNVTVQSSAKELSVHDFTPQQVELIKRTICNGATDDELQMFLYVCKQSNLDPFLKQIHAVKRYDSRIKDYKMEIQVGIDGYRAKAHRTGQCAGITDADFTYKVNPKTGVRLAQIDSATVTVRKIIGGHMCEFTATAYWDEYFPGDKMGFMWKKMPKGQLGKCAEALALRKAFPEEMPAFYIPEEMEKTVVDSKEIEEVVTKPRIDYQEQTDQLEHIKKLLAQMTEGKEPSEKVQALVEYTGVDSFKLLNKKTNVELDQIIDKLEQAS